jgi:hypothetical protein
MTCLGTDGVVKILTEHQSQGIEGCERARTSGAEQVLYIVSVGAS